MSFNKVILMGRLTAAPEMKQTPSGAFVCSFTLAVDRKYSRVEEKQCDFINILAWRSTAEFICRYFGKGQAALICGELQTRSWADINGHKHYTTEVVASEVSFCEAKKKSEGTYSSEAREGSQCENLPSQFTFSDINTDGELPF